MELNAKASPGQELATVRWWHQRHGRNELELCFTRAGINRTFSFKRRQLVAMLTDALVIVHPMLGRHRPDLPPVCWGRFSPLVDRIEGMKYLLGVEGNTLLRGEGERAAVQHSCVFGCNKKKFPVETAVSNCLRGICVFGGGLELQPSLSSGNGVRLGQTKASPIQNWPGDAKRTGQNPDFLQPVFWGLSHQDASSRSLCLTATSGPVLCELLQSSSEAVGISGSQNIP